MTDPTQDAGVIAVLLERFEKQRFPRALRIKEQVDAGETLSDTDLDFLNDVFRDAKEMMPLVERHPEYHDLVTRALGLYREITETALKNEQG